jgi:hypothetical protein
MSYLLVLAVSRTAWKRLAWAMGIVILFATVLSFVGYAAAISFGAALKIPLDAQKIAGATFLITGAIGIPVAFFYLAVHG